MIVSESSGTPELADMLQDLPDVARVLQVAGPQRLTSRAFREENTRVRVGKNIQAVFGGGDEFVVIAAPARWKVPNR